MSSTHRVRSLHHGLLVLGLCAGLGLTALSLTQCRMVSDSVTGVRLTPAGLSARNSCRKECESTFKSAMEDEQQRHRHAVEACGHDRNCRRAEEAKHRSNMERLADDRRSCKKNCYDEGSGHGGE